MGNSRQETQSPSKERPRWQWRRREVGGETGQVSTSYNEIKGKIHWDPGTSAQERQSLMPRQQTPSRSDALLLRLSGCSPGSAVPRQVWPKASRVKKMESSCRASGLGSGDQTLFSGKGGPPTGGGRRACSQSRQAGWRKRR